ncbi:hypothetical protein JTB14_036869 [Gonioctena quinquepunctata]|nr:hypothetical protein JTB14_036869 [Gonioctena quinquepunctata]
MQTAIYFLTICFNPSDTTGRPVDDMSEQQERKLQPSTSSCDAPPNVVPQPSTSSCNGTPNVEPQPSASSCDATPNVEPQPSTSSCDAMPNAMCLNFCYFAKNANAFPPPPPRRRTDKEKKMTREEKPIHEVKPPKGRKAKKTKLEEPVLSSSEEEQDTETCMFCNELFLHSKAEKVGFSVVASEEDNDTFIGDFCA